MTRPDPHLPAVQTRFQTLWAHALASLLLSLAGLLLGWQLSEQGHSRLASASQTSPALPELRSALAPQSAVQGLGTVAETPFAMLRTGWTALPIPIRPALHLATTDLTVLGRMNLDGG